VKLEHILLALDEEGNYYAFGPPLRLHQLLNYKALLCATGVLIRMDEKIVV
jgi:hypothetical protein